MHKIRNVLSFFCWVFNLTLLEISGMGFFFNSPDLSDHTRVQKNLEILRNLCHFTVNPGLNC